jgi:hypothetical protein
MQMDADNAKCPTCEAINAAAAKRAAEGKEDAAHGKAESACKATPDAEAAEKAEGAQEVARAEAASAKVEADVGQDGKPAEAAAPAALPAPKYPPLKHGEMAEAFRQLVRNVRTPHKIACITVFPFMFIPACDLGHAHQKDHLVILSCFFPQGLQCRAYL